MQRSWGLPEASIGLLTSAVQLGFVVGTLVFAFLAIADRLSPRRVFLGCSIIGAAANGAILVVPEEFVILLTLRFCTGFFLAGIYPVGMKIAASWYEQGLGRALGYLVGALVLGTAFPHLLRALGTDFSWEQVMLWVSVLAVGGGVLMASLVPDGPHLPRASPFNPRILGTVFRSRSFRASVFGYFGHMWELYTFWAFLPLWLIAYAERNALVLNVSGWSFAIIAVGFLGCVGGGAFSRRSGSARVATLQLAVSGLCCLVSPLVFELSPTLFLLFLLVWGVAVIGDSPQLSTLNAANAPREYVGSALTIANSLGFTISIISIYFASLFLVIVDPQYLFWMLVPGPLLGLIALRPLWMKRA